MSIACRNIIKELWTGVTKDPNEKKKKLPGCSNASLVRDRYLEYRVKDKVNHPPARKNLHSAMCDAIHSCVMVYEKAFDRHKSTIEEPSISGEFQTLGRLIIGLGGENVLETGITLNPVYGTPYIPGSALKGLTAHYCDRVWGVGGKKPEFQKGGKYHKDIFGTSEDSGHFTFHDAWITPGSLARSLVPDVMTPHHGDYYSKKQDANGGWIPPTDFDDPNPITFVSVSGIFLVSVSCDDPSEIGREYTKIVFGLLSEALEHWGIGGKTSSGYGRLKRENAPVPGMGGQGDQVMAAAIPGAPANQPRYRPGSIIRVTRREDPRERDRLYFVADDGIGGFIKSDRLAHLQIGEQTQLKIKSILTPPSYVFEDPEQPPPQNAGNRR